MFKKSLYGTLLLFIATSVFAQSDEIYGGLGGTIGYGLTMGYAKNISSTTTLRGEFAGGLKLAKDGVQDGVNYTGKFTNNRLGAFADWFPGSGGFRLTGGLTYNDTKFELNSTATGNATATINGKTTNLAGSYYNLAIKLPKVTPFVGIGYGHHTRKDKGWGFFTELGLVLGKFKAESSTDLVTKGTVTQADIDAQNQKTNDSLAKLSVIPSFSIGASYNF
ncbi:MAG: hypothetical protein RLY95_393 [Pseudomonadota bacterium]|jgi:hypothetical protein